MKQLIFLVLFFSYFTTNAQKLDIKLKQELDSIYALDQKYRNLMSLKGKQADSLAAILKISKDSLNRYLWDKQSHIDSINILRIEEIIKQYGYPGKTLVGIPTNEAVFYVVQHSSKIKEYIPYIEKAAMAGELPFKNYAMMLDRLLMRERKEQIYGTQIMGFRIGTGEMKMFVWPIKDPENVDSLRKKAGLELSVKDNAKRLDVDYKVITLEEAKKMEGK